MNSQIQSIINTIFAILFITTYSSMKLSYKSSTIFPCSYTAMSQLSKPITIPAELTPAQKEAALPFLAQEPPKTKLPKAKSLSRFFKKLAKSPKTCTKSSEIQTTQYKLTFVPIVKKNETVSESKTRATEIVWYDNREVTSTVTELAQRIWDEDNTVYKNLDTIVEWIGNGKEESNSILQSYMSHFELKDLKLEQAFRTLCSKLYLKGETQQIDRVLLQFSARYFECNSQSIFGSIGK